ncbi:hypothetical protein RQP46_000891 [Phenoliferia psychrophenolica]
MTHVLQPVPYFTDYDAAWGGPKSDGSDYQDEPYPYLHHLPLPLHGDDGVYISRYQQAGGHGLPLPGAFGLPSPPSHRVMLDAPPHYRSPVNVDHLAFLNEAIPEQYECSPHELLVSPTFQFEPLSPGRPFAERQRAVTEPRHHAAAPGPERKWLEYQGYKVDRDVRSRNSPETASAEVGDESEEETTSDGGTHTQKRRRRRKASELPRDYAQRRYTCPQCLKLCRTPR